MIRVIRNQILLIVTVLIMFSCEYDDTNLPPSEFAASFKYDGYTVKHIVWTDANPPGTAEVSYDVYIDNILFKSQKTHLWL
jgi:hypothetical protein